MLKKPSILLSSYTGLYQCWTPHQHQVNTSPSALPPPRARPSKKSSQRRTYADVYPSNPLSHESWPDCKPPVIPTPYEIFQQKKGSPYSKRRFYELVKIYHPDRNSHVDSFCGGLSHTVKLERYRLIIAANDILSDPIKRSAYDRYGAGWNGHPEAAVRHYYHPGEAKYKWGANADESPFHNATWEDWERWYHRNDKKSQDRVHMSHSTFLSFIALIATLGGVAQATRMGTYTSAIDQKIQSVTMECSELINSRTGFEQDRQTRVRHFLKTRDPSGLGLKDTEEESYRRILKPPDVYEGKMMNDRSDETSS
jgi:hypothetical protein